MPSKSYEGLSCPLSKLTSDLEGCTLLHNSYLTHTTIHILGSWEFVDLGSMHALY